MSSSIHGSKVWACGFLSALYCFAACTMLRLVVPFLATIFLPLVHSDSSTSRCPSLPCVVLFPPSQYRPRVPYECSLASFL